MTDPDVSPIKDSLDAILNLPNPQIDEGTFVRQYLELFAHPNPQSDHPIMNWLRVSGSPFSEVDVMRGGVVVITIPPLEDSSGDPLNPTPNGFVHSAFETARLMQTDSFRAADEHLRQTLIAAVRHKSPSKEFLQRWRDVFKFFNVADPFAAITDTGALTNPDTPLTRVGNISDLGDFEDD